MGAAGAGASAGGARTAAATAISAYDMLDEDDDAGAGAGAVAAPSPLSLASSASLSLRFEPYADVLTALKGLSQLARPLADFWGAQASTEHVTWRVVGGECRLFSICKEFLG